SLSLKGLVDDKVLAVEDFDRQVVEPLLQVVEEREDIKMLLVVNHMCSAYLMKYDRDPAPFAVFPSVKGSDAVQRFDEEIACLGAEHFRNGPDLMSSFFKGTL
ncbi:MAG: phosphoglycerate mutase, partial [Nitrospinales bacterium]